MSIDSEIVESIKRLDVIPAAYIKETSGEDPLENGFVGQFRAYSCFSDSLGAEYSFLRAVQAQVADATTCGSQVQRNTRSATVDSR